MGLNDFFDNFACGLGFGMMTGLSSFILGRGDGCCYGSFPMMGNFGYQSNQFDYIFDESYKNSFPQLDFSLISDSIWDMAKKSTDNYFKQIQAYADNSSSESCGCKMNIPDYSMPFSGYYFSNLQSPYLSDIQPFALNFIQQNQLPATFKTEAEVQINEKNAKLQTVKNETNVLINTKKTEQPKAEDEPEVRTASTYSSSAHDKYFNEMLSFVLEHEGGYVNHPHDRGGPTNKGVTQTTYNSYRRGKGLPIRSVKNITLDEAKDIYYSNYKACGANKISNPQLAMCVFDWANHSGPDNKALKIALKDCNGDVKQFIRYRSNFLHRLIANDPRQEVFRKGWDKRINDLSKFVMELPSAYS